MTAPRPPPLPFLGCRDSGTTLFLIVAADSSVCALVLVTVRARGVWWSSPSTSGRFWRGFRCMSVSGVSRRRRFSLLSSHLSHFFVCDVANTCSLWRLKVKKERDCASGCAGTCVGVSTSSALEAGARASPARRACFACRSPAVPLLFWAFADSGFASPFWHAARAAQARETRVRWLRLQHVSSGEDEDHHTTRPDTVSSPTTRPPSRASFASTAWAHRTRWRRARCCKPCRSPAVRPRRSSSTCAR